MSQTVAAVQFRPSGTSGPHSVPATASNSGRVGPRITFTDQIKSQTPEVPPAVTGHGQGAAYAPPPEFRPPANPSAVPAMDASRVAPPNSATRQMMDLAANDEKQLSLRKKVEFSGKDDVRMISPRKPGSPQDSDDDEFGAGGRGGSGRPEGPPDDYSDDDDADDEEADIYNRPDGSGANNGMTPEELARYEAERDRIKLVKSQEDAAERTRMIRKYKRIQRRNKDVVYKSDQELRIMELDMLRDVVDDLSYLEESEYWVSNIKRTVVAVAWFIELAFKYMDIPGISMDNYQRNISLTIDQLEEPLYELFEQYLCTSTRAMNPFWKIAVTIALNMCTFIIHKNFTKTAEEQMKERELAKTQAAAAQLPPPPPTLEPDSDDEVEHAPYKPPPMSAKPQPRPRLVTNNPDPLASPMAMPSLDAAMNRAAATAPVIVPMPAASPVQAADATPVRRFSADNPLLQGISESK